MPASRPLVWSKDAETDLFEIWDYLALKASPNVGDNRLRDIHRTVGNLADWPLLGRERVDIRAGLRSLACPPHVIFYRVEPGRVEILRILHGHRDIIRVFSLRTPIDAGRPSDLYRSCEIAGPRRRFLSILS